MSFSLFKLQLKSPPMISLLSCGVWEEINVFSELKNVILSLSLLGAYKLTIVSKVSSILAFTRSFLPSFDLCTFNISILYGGMCLPRVCKLFFYQVCLHAGWVC